ncbi:MAG: hypothetical protein HZB29_10860 [Nitrospinae bacterium]|nr:hypothetical protein [Nitrospinota bacterium]
MDAKLTRELVGHSAPMAGSVCINEIGPIGGASYVHGYSACVTLIGKTGPDENDGK